MRTCCLRMLSRRNSKPIMSTSQIAKYTVRSGARTYLEIIASVETRGFKVSETAKKVLEKPSILSRWDLTYDLVFTRASDIPSAVKERLDKGLVVDVSREVALLLCEQVSREEMEKAGFKTLTIMHKPVEVDRILNMIRLFVGEYTDEQGHTVFGVGAVNCCFESHPQMGKLEDHEGLIFLEKVLKKK